MSWPTRILFLRQGQEHPKHASRALDTKPSAHISPTVNDTCVEAEENKRATLSHWRSLKLLNYRDCQHRWRWLLNAGLSMDNYAAPGQQRRQSSTMRCVSQQMMASSLIWTKRKPPNKVAGRYHQALSGALRNSRYPGCLFIAACTFSRSYPRSSAGRS